MISITQTLGLAMIQDLGRDQNYRHGVSIGGAMDRLALQLGNALLGNPSGAAGIEATLFPLQIRFESDTVAAVTGAVCEADIDGWPLPPNWSFAARKGQVLTLKRPISGSFAYVTFGGGIDVPVILGSRSTHLRCAFGGHEGRMLKTGDLIPLGSDTKATLAPPAGGMGAQSPLSSLNAPQSTMVPTGETPVLRYLPAGEYDSFEQDALEALEQTRWQITQHSSRAGYRLAGATLKLKEKLEMRSHGIVPGVIQVPPGGSPIIQTADSQTSGGYPKIGTVIEADLWRLAQTRINSHIRFVKCDYQEALSAWREQRSYLEKVRIIADSCRKISA